MAVLEELHLEALSLEAKFHAGFNERGNALSRLGRVEGLEIKQGLGRLAYKPYPFGHVFSPGGTASFVSNLQAYRSKLSTYKEPEPGPRREAEPDPASNVVERGFKWIQSVFQ